MIDPGLCASSSNTWAFSQSIGSTLATGASMKSQQEIGRNSTDSGSVSPYAARTGADGPFFGSTQCVQRQRRTRRIESSTKIEHLQDMREGAYFQTCRCCTLHVRRARVLLVQQVADEPALVRASCLYYHAVHADMRTLREGITMVVESSKSSSASANKA